MIKLTFSNLTVSNQRSNQMKNPFHITLAGLAIVMIGLLAFQGLISL